MPPIRKQKRPVRIRRIKATMIEFYGLLRRIYEHAEQTGILHLLARSRARILQLYSLYRDDTDLHFVMIDPGRELEWLNLLDDESLDYLERDCRQLAEYYGLQIYNQYPRQPSSGNIFWRMTVEEQYRYLQEQVLDPDPGSTARYLRSLRPSMKLGGLFALDRSFMNETLRVFLNLKEDGTDNYVWADMSEDGWSETPSIGSKYHQTTAPRTGIFSRERGFIYTRLNAKFTNSDGREAVFSYVNDNERELVRDPLDRGTYNYYPGANYIDLGIETLSGGEHDIYDVIPFMEVLPGEEKKRLEGSLDKCNFHMGLIWGNSKYWRLRYGGVF